MPYEYLEDAVTSDVTFRASGRDLDELFTAAADATTNCMVEELDSVRPAVTLPLSVEAAALDLLLMRFLDEIVFHKDAKGLMLRAGHVRVAEAPAGYRVTAELHGEPIDGTRHALAADVKAVTLHGLKVVPAGDGGWEAEVTLDV
jgi:SHS2 domain-containing protein